MIDLDSNYSQKALGELVGISQPTVSALVREGRIPASGSLRAALLAYCANLREQAAGRARTSDGPTMADERARLTRVRRQAEELKLRQMAGTLVLAEGVRNALGPILADVRNGILNVPARLSAKLAAESDPAAVNHVLYKELHQALTDLATAPSRILPPRGGKAMNTAPPDPGSVPTP